MLEAPFNIKQLLPSHQWSVGLRWVAKPMLLPRLGGVYILLMHLQESTHIILPKLGATTLKSGYYFYVGSANGVAGLAIKVSRHWLNKQDAGQKTTVDYLREHMTMQGAWVIPDTAHTTLACDVASAFSQSKCEVIKDSNGGDCHCDSHIFYIEDK